MNLESCGILKNYTNFNFLSCHFVNILEKSPLTHKFTFINRGDTVKHFSKDLFIGLNSSYPLQSRFFN